MTDYIPASQSPIDHVLYRMYNHNDLLVYVGITNTPRGRIGNHRDGKWWWPNVATITLQRFGTRAELEAAELAEIREKQPRYNLANNPRYVYSPKDCQDDGHPAEPGQLCEACDDERIVALTSLEEEQIEMELLQEYSEPFIPCTDDFYYPHNPLTYLNRAAS